MSNKKAIRAAYGECLVDMGEKLANLVVLDADLSGATMTSGFAKAFPERFFNAGIAEANMVSMSAGLALSGFLPFCSTFAIFGAGRAYEQVRNSIAYQGLNVKLAMTHGGISIGEDGGSHQSIEDIALMRVIPGMTVIVPGDANEARSAIWAAAQYDGPVYIRLARPATEVLMPQPFEIGKANTLKDGSDVALFTCGIMLPITLEVADKLSKVGISAAVINMHTIKPIDKQAVLKYANQCQRVVTIEEHSVIGGLGDAVSDVLIGKVPVEFLKIGVNDRFGQSGTYDQLMKEYGLDSDSVEKQIINFLERGN